MREYALSLILTALICGLLPSFLSKGTAQALVKMTCGLVLVIAAVGPLKKVEWEIWEESLFPPESSCFAIDQGEDLARRAMEDIIKAETEAYIQDKAAQLGAEVQAEVTLSKETPPLPTSVALQGVLSPAVRQQLQELICTQLDIAKENLTWKGEP